LTQSPASVTLSRLCDRLCDLTSRSSGETTCILRRRFEAT
jgi:hypothetical protein